MARVGLNRFCHLFIPYTKHSSTAIARHLWNIGLKCEIEGTSQLIGRRRSVRKRYARDLKIAARNDR